MIDNDDEQRSSDPFPYLQIHRTVEAMAANMSAAFKMPIEKAGWGLIVFWRRCADPREIEALYDAGKRAVILDGTTLSRRLTIAFGADLDHELLVEVGILAKEEGGFRVRGCSRYFRILEERQKSSVWGSAGGKKSAALRKGGLNPPCLPGLDLTKGGATPPSLPGLEIARGGQQEMRDERRELRDETDRSLRSKRKPSANDVWNELRSTFEHHGVPVPEIHPRERNDRIQTLLRQLPEPSPVLLDQVLFMALKVHDGLRAAANPLGYLQKMLKDPVTRQELLDAVTIEANAA